MKERQSHEKRRYAFNHDIATGKKDPVVFIDATSLGKAWKEFRRHHVQHAKRKNYIVLG